MSSDDGFRRAVGAAVSAGLIPASEDATGAGVAGAAGAGAAGAGGAGAGVEKELKVSAG